MRFAAPDHVSGITLSVGPFSVVDGYVEVPDDLGAGDLGGLSMNGFTPVTADAPSPAKPSKADPAPPSTSSKTEPADGAAAKEA